MKNITLTQRLSEDFDTVKMFDIKILLDDTQIGYAELFVAYDEDGEETAAYVKSIEIQLPYRNHGYGTQVLKSIAEQHGGIYICPDNENAERLYARIGEKVDTAPEAFASELDSWDAMYEIR